MNRKTKKLESELAKKLVHIVMQVLDFRYKNKDMSQQLLADKMGVSESYLSRVLGSSKYNLTLKTIVKMEQALGEEILLTPNDYDAFLIKNYKEIVSLARALFENEISEDDRRSFIEDIDRLLTEQKAKYSQTKSDFPNRSMRSNEYADIKELASH